MLRKGIKIPKEVFNSMPKDFRRYIKREIRNFFSLVIYNPKLTEEIQKENPFLFSETITVSHGVLAARIYDVRTGVCVGLS